MMEAPPAAALIMPEANFLFEVFIIALDAPAHLGEIDKAAERHVRVDGCTLIRPRGIGDNMQELLMLRRNVPRVRHAQSRTADPGTVRGGAATCADRARPGYGRARPRALPVLSRHARGKG